MKKTTKKNINLAFTLAEMMVVLVVFSAIAAATLPVISYKQDLSVVSGGGDPWFENEDYNGLSYYNSGSALTNTSAVMIGGQVGADAETIGYPQLIIVKKTPNDNIFGGSDIALFKYYNGNSFYGGRILIGSGSDDSVTDSIALGASAMYAEAVSASSKIKANKSIAIGTYAASNGGENTRQFDNAVAIGYKSSVSKHGGSDNSGNVSIGIESGGEMFGRAASADESDSVSIGRYAGAYADYKVSGILGARTKYNVLIGNCAGANKVKMRFANNIAIGTEALSGITSDEESPKIENNVGIGHRALFGLYTVAARDSVSGSVAIGTNAAYGAHGQYAISIGAESCGSNSAPIIGYYASCNYNLVNQNSVVLGAYAGASSEPDKYSRVFGDSRPIIIGAYSAYNVHSNPSPEPSDPVIIGYGALSHFTSDGKMPDKSWTSFPDVAIGYMVGQDAYGELGNSVLIGTYAGANATSLVNSVCMGYGTCADSDGHYDVRIAPYGINKVSTRYAKLGKHFSHIGFIGSLYGPELVGAKESAIQVLRWAQDGDSDQATLVISPLMSQDDDRSKYNKSSIILSATKVFGPSATFDIFSDRRLKENIKPARYGLNEIRKINVYEYTWKSDETNAPQIGVIAQEMKEVIPEGVHQAENGYFTIDSLWLVYSMVNAIQELDKIVINLQHSVKTYAREYVSLAKRVVVLEQQVRKLEKENKSLSKDIQVAYKKSKNAERQQ